MRRNTIRIALTCICLTSAIVQGQVTYDWIGGNGFWTSTANWSGGGGFPGANDTARFSAGGTYVISSTGTRTVGAIDWVDSGANFHVFSDSLNSAFFTVNDDFTINGTLELTSDDNVFSVLRREGTITNAASGIINMNGNSSTVQRFLRADLFVNNGTVNVDGSSQFDETDGVFTNNASVVVADGATLSFGSSNVFNQDAGTFNNQGGFLFASDTLNFNGGSFTGNPVQLSNSTLNNDTTGTGTFDLFGANSYRGDLDPNQFLNLRSNSTASQFTLASADFTNRSIINIESNDNVFSVLRREGTITNAASGIINMNGNSSTVQRFLRADLFVNNGTVNVDGSSQFDETGGVFTNNASVVVADGATLSFGSSNVFNQDAGTFNNQGGFLFASDTLNFNGGSFTGNPIQLSNSTLNNDTTGTGTFDLFGANSYRGDLDPNQFLNLRSNSTASQFTLASADFTNRSIINIESNDNVFSVLRREGTITNAASGIINMNGNSSTVQRFLRADLFVNNGTVNVDGSSQFDETDGVFTNNASVVVADGATLSFGSSNVFNQDAGTFNNQGGFLFSSDTLNFNGGSFTGNPIQLSNSTLNNDTTGTGTFDLFGANSYRGDLDPNQFLNLRSNSTASQFTLASADFTNRSIINIESNDNVFSVLRREGTITNAASGIINMNGNSSTVQRFLRADLFVNNGTVNVDGSSQFDETDGVFTNNASVVVADGATLSFGSSNVFNQDAGTFNNQGGFLFSSDTLNFNGGSFTGNPVQLSNSTLNIHGTGTGTFNLTGINTYSGDLAANQILNLMATSSATQSTSSTSFTNRGQINITSSANGVSSSLNGNTITNGMNGRIYFDGTGGATSTVLQIDAVVNNQGMIEIGAVTNVRLGSGSDTHMNSGTIVNRANSLLLADGLSTTATGAMIGVGTWTADTFMIDGRISPGFSIGKMTLNDIKGVSLRSNAKVRMELGGTIQGASYDHLEVTNAIQLDGDLQVRIIDGFLASLQTTDTFDIITTTVSGGVTGIFAGLPTGTRFDTHDGFGSFEINYLGNVVQIGEFQEYLDGDFDNSGAYGCEDIDALVADIIAGNDTPMFDIDGDGSVDQGDLNLWLAQAGAVAGFDNPILPGDANLDGAVDGSDFNVWNSNKFTLAAAWCSGDFNADGAVDGTDFNVWNANKFTSSNFSSVTAVPEPSQSLAMPMVLVGIACLRRRRQKVQC